MQLLPRALVWKDVPPQHFEGRNSGRFERLLPGPAPLPSSSSGEGATPFGKRQRREASPPPLGCGPVRDSKLAYER